jgi:hypothetical protein
VFSLGAVLYEMICGTSPWTRRQEIERLMGVGKNAQPRPMHSLRRAIPPELEALVEQALAWDQDQRPTAREFAAVLTRLLDRLGDAPADMVAPAVSGAGVYV